MISKKVPAKIGLIKPKAFNNKNNFRREAHKALDDLFDKCNNVSAFSLCVFDEENNCNTPAVYSLKDCCNFSPLDIPEKTKRALTWAIYKGW